jgi:predicted enzyme related to lactoylglutathione lyase
MKKSKQPLRWPSLLACLIPVSAGAASLPPVTSAPSQEHHAGKVVLVELITPDIAQAEKFYGGLFGWTFQDQQGFRFPYAEALDNGQPVAGLVQRPAPTDEHRQSAWLNFISAPDVDAAVKAATAAGARVLEPPHDLPARGREAVLADPQGAVFAVLASSSGDPADVLAPTGDWIWSSVAATDPVADADFYKTVFGYEVDPLEAAGHSLLATEGYARASVNGLPPNHPNAHPHWLNFVRVNAVGAAVAQAKLLGGRVLAGPWTDRHGGQMAVIADPAGAPVGLMEWAESDSKEVGQ